MSDYKAYIYMNNAATSWPKAPGVAEAMAESVRAIPGEANRGGVEDFDVFMEVRKELAALMGVSDPLQIALGCNSTWGLNQAIFGYPLSKGDTILYTKAEHNAVLRPVHRLMQKGIQAVALPVNQVGRLEILTLRKALEEYKPKLLILTHASNVTGAIQDAEVLVKEAKEANTAVLLDVSQTLGCVQVKLEEWGVDMAAFTGHKYLLEPQGTGGVYVRPGLELIPHIIGGTGIKSDQKEMPEEMPLHLEAGTGNEPSYHGLLAALRWSIEHPADAEALHARTNRLSRVLEELGCKVIVPEGVTTPVVSFIIPGISSADAADILTGSYDIILRTGLHCAPDIMEDIQMPGGTIRLSLSRFTTEEEVETVLEAVQELVESGV